MRRKIFAGAGAFAFALAGYHATAPAEESLAERASEFAAAVPDVPDNWFLLEQKTVETVRDRESALSSGQMPTVGSLAFLPVDGDLECERISVSFADGGSEWLELSAGTLLQQGTLYPVELQPDYQDRELIRINYTCSPVAGAEVALNIYAAE